jgi:FAD/FMN-containing dehydrogenase
MQLTPITSWGKLTNDFHRVVSYKDSSHFINFIKLNPQYRHLAYGMGRSYGDICLNSDGILWQTTGLNHFIRFNSTTGRLLCEAGVLLRDIQEFFIPKGWMLPVTPGTQMVTVGGAIANDIHGKNHHSLGSFGDHINLIKLQRTDGSTLECGPLQNPEWFAATVGGLGLTGIISEAEIQLKPTIGPWLDSEIIAYKHLSEFFHLADSSEANWEHTVSWIDCMSSSHRGIFMRANPNQDLKMIFPNKVGVKMPFTPPISLINRFTLSPFNALYYNLKRSQSGKDIVHHEQFFYPLDKLLEWNRMYGPKGFYQYQSVIPRAVGQDATQEMLNEIRKSGEGSFLGVLKTFGNRYSVGMLSFPFPGVTLALDFPNHGSTTHKLFERLDAIVRDAKGRLYLAKDARMPRELFESGYPKLCEFLKYRDPRISSELSRRLMGY